MTTTTVLQSPPGSILKIPTIMLKENTNTALTRVTLAVKPRGSVARFRHVIQRQIHFCRSPRQRMR